MGYTGTIIGGVVKLPPEVAWPDGTLVRIEQVEPASDRRPFVEKLKAIAESLPDLPEDWASQHDHYVRGSRVITEPGQGAGPRLLAHEQ